MVVSAIDFLNNWFHELNPGIQAMIGLSSILGFFLVFLTYKAIEMSRDVSH